MGTGTNRLINVFEGTLEQLVNRLISQRKPNVPPQDFYVYTTSTESFFIYRKTRLSQKVATSLGLKFYRGFTITAHVPELKLVVNNR